MSRFVIAAYRPKPDKQAELEELVRGHVFFLHAAGLATNRPPYIMKAKDGTIVEVFEWVSAEAIEAAHDNQDVKALWAQFDACCTHVTLGSLEECGKLFAEFEPVDA